MPTYHRVLIKCDNKEGWTFSWSPPEFIHHQVLGFTDIQDWAFAEIIWWEVGR